MPVQPIKRKTEFDTLLPAIGTAVGAYYGGPQGAAAGYQAGTTVASIGGKFAGTDKPVEQAPEKATEGSTVIDRRMSFLNSTQTAGADQETPAEKHRREAEERARGGQ